MCQSVIATTNTKRRTDQQYAKTYYGLLTNYDYLLIIYVMKRFTQPLRPLLWVASSQRDYRNFPSGVQEQFGFELFLVQTGQHPPSAKPLKGFGGGVLELIEDFEGDTYRAVYTVRFAEAVYVLHAFKKKSTRGAKTPKPDIDLIERRLRDAATAYGSEFKPEKRP